MKQTITFVSVTILLLTILIFTTSCPPEALLPNATSVGILSGGDQTGLIETTLDNLVTIVVKDQYDNPYANASLYFEVTEGSVSSEAEITANDGTAQVLWTLGSTIGTQTLTITCFEADETTHVEGSPLLVYATAFNEAFGIEIYSGNNQSAKPEEALSEPVKVLVKDKNDIPFEGASVNFSVTEGSVLASEAVTDENGIAATTWTLGSTLGEQSLTVTTFKEDGTTHLVNSPLRLTASAKNESDYFTDPRDNHKYKIVTIGLQTWFAENLNASKYTDGSQIPFIENEREWCNLESAGVCWYDDDIHPDAPVYGALYNAYAAQNYNLCPVGWHVPTDEDWKQLEQYLGMSEDNLDKTGWRGNPVGAMLKSANGWYLEGNGTNETGFNALPSGYRSNTRGTGYTGNGAFTMFWTSSSNNEKTNWIRHLSYSTGGINRSYMELTFGYPVRCVKD